MRWKKLGRIFEPDGNFEWMRTHAANPFAEHLSGDLFRIFFSCRNERQCSSIGFVDIDINDPIEILSISTGPVLSPGEVGLFDDSGISLSCITRINGRKYLYYIGWNLGVTVPWRNSIGLAVYDDVAQRFVKYGKSPVMDRSEIDPYSLSYPFVLADEGCCRMWYGSNLSWGKGRKEMTHVIKYAESDDGITWRRGGGVCIDLAHENEHSVSKPFVVKEEGLYKMWYSYKGGPASDTYRIGYAESEDAIHWVRKDHEVGIDVSESGWDSETISYPAVFDHKAARYMLYNGNGYGRTGFGLAVLE